MYTYELLEHMHSARRETAASTFYDLTKLLGACVRCNGDLFWRTVSVDQPSHRAFLDSLFHEHRFFSYTVKAHEEMWPHIRGAGSIERANRKIIHDWPQIELMTSTPRAFNVSA